MQALDVDEIVERFTALARPPDAVRRRHRRAAPRGPGRRSPPAAGGRPGDVPRPRPRHLSLRHVVEPDGRRRLRRDRPRPARHRSRRRDHQGLHDARRRRTLPDRAHRCRRRPARRRRPRVRHGHRAAPAGRVVGLRDAAPRRAPEQPHRAGRDEARRPRRVRDDQGVHASTASTVARCRSYPDRSDVLARVEPVYETLPGWGTGLGDVREPGPAAGGRPCPDRARRARGRHPRAGRRRRRRARRLRALDS